VRERAGRDPFAADAAASAEALVEREAGRWRARLLLRDAAGAVLLRREFDDASEGCAAVASAVAVSVAFALGPAPPAPAAPVAPPRPPEVAPRPVPPAAPVAPVAPRPVPRRARLVASVEALWGPLPDLSASVALQADVLLTRRWAVSLGAALSPERRVDTWAFGLTRFAASACFRAHPHRRVELAPCAGVTVGLVHAVTFGPAPVEPGNYPWLAVLLEGRAVARVAGPVVAQAALGGAWAPLRQDFVVLPSSRSAFTQSTLAAWASVGAGVEW